MGAGVGCFLFGRDANNFCAVGGEDKPQRLWFVTMGDMSQFRFFFFFSLDFKNY